MYFCNLHTFSLKKIILIQAHKNISLLNQVIKAYNDPNLVVYVHVDSKSTINLGDINPNAILIKKRFDVQWGEFSQVEATLSSLTQINDEQIDYSHIILVSGQDYPIAKNSEIIGFLDDNKEHSFIDFSPINDNNHASMKWRYNHLHFPKKEIIKQKFYSLLYLTKLKQKFDRKPLDNMQFYYGSQWWILSKEMVEYALAKSDSRTKKYFKYVHCSDELYFQTICLNSPLSHKIKNENYRYMEWEEYDHPKTLTVEDYSKIESSKKIFCRKIDLPESAELIQKLAHNRNQYNA